LTNTTLQVFIEGEAMTPLRYSPLKQNQSLYNNAIASQNPGVVPWKREMMLERSPHHS
jgi:hypothetical protein